MSLCCIEDIKIIDTDTSDSPKSFLSSGTREHHRVQQQSGTRGGNSQACCDPRCVPGIHTAGYRVPGVITVNTGCALFTTRVLTDASIAIPG